MVMHKNEHLYQYLLTGPASFLGSQKIAIRFSWLVLKIGNPKGIQQNQFVFVDSLDSLWIELDSFRIPSNFCWLGMDSLWIALDCFGFLWILAMDSSDHS